jgi:hypothetical protein
MILRGVASLFFMLLSLPLVAQECKTLECDCESIPNSLWRSQCERVVEVAASCNVLGESLNFCQAAGVTAKSLPLVVARLPFQAVEDIESAVDQVRLLSWAVREDNTAAVTLQNRGDLKAALLKRKSENKTRRQLHRLSIGVAQYYRDTGRVADIPVLFEGLGRRHEKDAGLSQAAGLKLWRAAELSDHQKLSQVLAQRMLRNAAMEMEMAADLAARLKQYSRASELWAKSAQITDQLVIWKQELTSKATVITFYQQGSAAKWYQSALMALLDEDDGFAVEAKLKSDKRWVLLPAD